MVFGNGPNIEMFEFKDAHQGQAQTLQDIGYTHISFISRQNTLMRQLNSWRKLEVNPISEPHVNTKYEDTEGNQTVYVKSPWGSLIELQTVPNGFYYPYDSEAEVFVPKKVDN